MLAQAAIGHTPDPTKCTTPRPRRHGVERLQALQQITSTIAESLSQGSEQAQSGGTDKSLVGRASRLALCPSHRLAYRKQALDPPLCLWCIACPGDGR